MSYWNDIKAADLKILTGPAVYIFWRNSKPIYVGATRHGIGRPLSCTHKMKQFFQDPEVSLSFEPVESEREAFRLEEELIAEYKPEFNGTQKDGYRRYRMRHRAARKHRGGILPKDIVQRLKMKQRVIPEYLPEHVKVMLEASSDHMYRVKEV